MFPASKIKGGYLSMSMSWTWTSYFLAQDYRGDSDQCQGHTSFEKRNVPDLIAVISRVSAGFPVRRQSF